MLYVTASGNYDILLRFHNNQSSGEATLKIGKQVLNQSIFKDQNELLFKSVLLQKGNSDLLATLKLDNNTKGPWQVDVIKL